jgi:hypothetical protein
MPPVQAIDAAKASPVAAGPAYLTGSLCTYTSELSASRANTVRPPPWPRLRTGHSRVQGTGSASKVRAVAPVIRLSVRSPNTTS